MNATQPYGAHHQAPYMDSHHTHYPPSSGTPYSHYPQSAAIYQPTYSTTYGAPHTQYHYAYPHPVTPPQSATHHPSHYAHQHMGLPGMATAPPSAQAGQAYGQQQPPQQQHVPDTTGQKAPPGMKPKVTATLWEDEGTLCFQVEVDGICVARREDNHMINGTKLLNVAQMTRGRRDGLLKAEKLRNVVKIGPMHLKGVWIPFERALDFANKEKITERLYPLFVSNVGALLHQPQNNNTGTARRSDSIQQSQSQVQAQQPHQTPQHQRAPQSTQQASATHSSSQHISHSGQSAAPGSAQAPGRPGIDRAHTFPTPPVSATSAVPYGSTTGQYEYGTQSSVPQPLSLETGLANARSMPTTPATTPPENALHNMQHGFAGQSYDGSRQVFANQATESSYGSASAVYGQSVPSQVSSQTHREDTKTSAADHDAAYAHSHAVYSDRYTYSGEQTTTPTIKDSPKHTGSGRATPRTLASSQPAWPSQYGDRTQQFPPPSNMYMTNNARTVANGYPSQYSNGFTSNKRVRELDDDEDPYARSDSHTNDGLKRRKTMGDEHSSMQRPAPVQHR